VNARFSFRSGSVDIVGLDTSPEPLMSLLSVLACTPQPSATTELLDSSVTHDQPVAP
jgi:hypothetical protein